MRQPSQGPAFNAALKSEQSSTPTGPAVEDLTYPALLTALKNSTTQKDQIVQRRIGARNDPDAISKESRRAGRISCPKE
ncbi:MAG TPA: hypothetical protein VMW70_04875 [Burkholderiales bacterium]|nr:hypothetical protein [Burkholderiales bacterium]